MAPSPMASMQYAWLAFEALVRSLPSSPYFMFLVACNNVRCCSSAT